MRWMLNEINKLIWPSPAGLGIMNEDLWDQTVDVALEGAVIEETPGEEAFRTDLAARALVSLLEENPDLDVRGLDWEPRVVDITPGGE